MALTTEYTESDVQVVIVSVNDGDIPHIRQTEPFREHISSFPHVFFFKSNVHDALAVGIFVKA